jgi:hypothetical protein
MAPLSFIPIRMTGLTAGLLLLATTLAQAGDRVHYTVPARTTVTARSSPAVSRPASARSTTTFVIYVSQPARPNGSAPTPEGASSPGGEMTVPVGGSVVIYVAQERAVPISVIETAGIPSNGSPK